MRPSEQLVAQPAQLEIFVVTLCVGWFMLICLEKIGEGPFIERSNSFDHRRFSMGFEGFEKLFSQWHSVSWCFLRRLVLWRTCFYRGVPVKVLTVYKEPMHVQSTSKSWKTSAKESLFWKAMRNKPSMFKQLLNVLNTEYSSTLMFSQTMSHYSWDKPTPLSPESCTTWSCRWQRSCVFRGVFLFWRFKCNNSTSPFDGGFKNSARTCGFAQDYKPSLVEVVVSGLFFIFPVDLGCAKIAPLLLLPSKIMKNTPQTMFFLFFEVFCFSTPQPRLFVFTSRQAKRFAQLSGLPGALKLSASGNQIDLLVDGSATTRRSALRSREGFHERFFLRQPQALVFRKGKKVEYLGKQPELLEQDSKNTGSLQDLWKKKSGWWKSIPITGVEDPWKLIFITEPFSKDLIQRRLHSPLTLACEASF